MKELLTRSLTKISWILVIAMMGFSFTACEDDDDDNGDDNGDEIVLDGIYVKGDATALTSLESDGMFEVGKNEVNQEEREGLYEKYVALSSDGGFNIVQVAGDQQMTYGPGSDFDVVPEEDRDVEEPQVDFWRGSFTESDDQFTVPEDGLYHIAIDTELEKVVVVPVSWGLIGDATPGGWDDDTELESQGFDLENMTFESEEIEMRNGEYKFRYSGGWKVEIDTTLELDGGDVGVKVNTNLGGSLDDLARGGDNITMDDPGEYTVTMDWSLTDGYSASMERTGDLTLTNWEGVKLDAVGDGISQDNDDAIEDPSSWEWGYKLLADNEGEPEVDGDVYTWTWTEVILEADSGFKIRTEDGEASPENDISFDIGYDAVDTDNSSDLVDNADGNIIVTEKATFNITTVIDAADGDTKTITIEEAK